MLRHRQSSGTRLAYRPSNLSSPPGNLRPLVGSLLKNLLLTLSIEIPVDISFRSPLSIACLHVVSSLVDVPRLTSRQLYRWQLVPRGSRPRVVVSVPVSALVRVNRSRIALEVLDVLVVVLGVRHSSFMATDRLPRVRHSV